MVKITRIFYGIRNQDSLKENKDLGNYLEEIESLPPMKLKYVQIEKPSATDRHVMVYERGDKSKTLFFHVMDYAMEDGIFVTTGSGDYVSEDGVLKEIIRTAVESPQFLTERDYQKRKLIKKP